MNNLICCPFCGSDELSVDELNRQDKAVFNRDGKRRKGIQISHAVWCSCCGVYGPNSFSMLEGNELTASMIHDSEQAAILAWNARKPISDKALELVNKIFVSAIAAIDGKKEE